MEQRQYPYATDEQVAYATLLQWGMSIGFVLLVATFGLYMFGVLDPYVPVEELPNYWTLSAKEYLQATNTPTGWGWTSLVHHGDYSTYVAIALLSLVTIFCYLRIIPAFHRNGDKAYLIISVLEVAVLSLAASGVLVVGH